ncbi:MAG: TetR/AcrR family transcriptional regulator [Oscillospiraceae bacterium]|nr:TetR/AcrR family transcriptional regulator [Oscillospiraceae bacterium]
MPKPTFFRLPEEKRRRLMDAAWEEFTQVDFAEASINRIIRSAHIPRGSFYQYFENKSDLFFHMLDELLEEGAAFALGLLRDTGGDVFQIPLLAFDELIEADGNAVPRLGQAIRLLQLNQGLDLLRVLTPTCREPSPLLAAVDRTGFRRGDDGFAVSIVTLLLSGFICSIMNILRGVSSYDESRHALEEQTEIIRLGALSAPEKGAGV